MKYLCVFRGFERAGRLVFVRESSLLIFLYTVVVALLGFTPDASAGTITGRVTGMGAKSVPHAVVYVEPVRARTFLPRTRQATIDQRQKEFVPRVLPIVKGEAVNFLNSDPFLHSVHTFQGHRTRFNLAMLPEAKPITRTFDEPGEVAVLCDIHPEMVAYIIVLETPYAAVTGEDGHYQIPDIPPGPYTLKTWHEKLKVVSQPLTVEGDETLELNLDLPS